MILLYSTYSTLRLTVAVPARGRSVTNEVRICYTTPDVCPLAITSTAGWKPVVRCLGLSKLYRSDGGMGSHSGAC
jgi:hypothetical protein